MAAAMAAVWPVSESASDVPWQTRDGGLEVQDVAVGSGTTVVEGANVEVHYTGMLGDGTVFDSSLDRDETFTFRVGQGQVIAGWEQGLVGMQVGGTRRLKIPAALGYGDRSTGSIPPGSTLYFEVELFAVQAPRIPPDAPRAATIFRKGKQGIEFSDVVLGTGSKAKSGERVCVDVAIWADGTLVDHSYTKPQCWWFRYDHSLVMEGLTLGMKGMREGGVRQIRVPASLAVSARAEAASVPPGVDLLVDVVLVEAD